MTKEVELDVDKKYFVYILANYTNTVLYTGITNNIERRFFEHKLKTNPNSFSAKYKTNKLVWFEEFNSPIEAIETEKRIKGWVRKRKIKLIEELNPEWKNLSS